MFEAGVTPCLAPIPENARVFVTLDCDGLDPAVMPGVMAQAPGGLTYWHMVDMLAGLARRSRLVGFNIVELAPERDVGNISALTAARMVMNAIAAIEKSQPWRPATGGRQPWPVDFVAGGFRGRGGDVLICFPAAIPYTASSSTGAGPLCRRRDEEIPGILEGGQSYEIPW